MIQTVSILGVGLIGASLGKALLKNGAASEVRGFGRRRENLEIALKSHCITHIAESLEDAVSGAQIVMVCTPVETIAHSIRQALPFVEKGTIFTDVGSTKASLFEDFQGICEAQGCFFIGGHPIAGKETSGAAVADSELYVGKTTVLTNNQPFSAYETVAKMWRSVGARVVYMSAKEHDAVLAKTSHLPHLLACALSAVTPPELYPFSGTGYDSMTRLAAGNPEVWRDILTDNRRNVLSALDVYLKQLQQLYDVLGGGDAAALEAFLHSAKKNRDALGN